MSKSKEELNKLKEEVETVNEKLAELTEEEIAQVSGGRVAPRGPHIHDFGQHVGDKLAVAGMATVNDGVDGPAAIR